MEYNDTMELFAVLKKIEGEGMRYILQIICGILLVLFLTGCGEINYIGEVSSYAEKEISETYQLYMEEDVVSTEEEKIFFYVENQSDEDLSYGSDWHLEVFHEEAWHKVPIRLPDGNQDINFCTAIISRAGKTNKEMLPMSLYSYRFQSGKYRLVQYIEEEDKIMAVEFQMEERKEE